MLLVTCMALMWTTQEAVAAGATLPALSMPDLSSVGRWFTDPHWGKLPQEKAGTAAGHSHRASAASTRAGGGSGRKPGKGKGQLATYTPYKQTFKRGGSAKVTGFSAKTSKRVPAKSSATSTLFRNSDGSFTRKVSEGTVNYRDSSGTWRPIDTRVSKGADGRWHEDANSLTVDFAAQAADPALASFAVDAKHSLSYGLRGAAKVTARVSGAKTTYPGVLPHTDVSLSPVATGLKEAIVLHSAQAANTWVFPLDLKGLRPVAAESGRIDLVNAAGKTVEVIPPAYAYDSKVDPHSGEPATTHAVTYALSTVSGVPQLTVTLNPAWLHDAARVFPVTVDPTITTWSNTTYAETNNVADHSGEQTIKVGSYDSGTHKANAFENTWYKPFDGSNVTVTAASMHLFDTWASTCTAERFDVAQISTSWSPFATSTYTYPGPAYGSSIGNTTPTVANACANTAADRTVGDWVSVTLANSAIQKWASGTLADYGVAVYASTTDALHWKQFGSVNDSGYEPYLTYTYTGNAAPEMITRYPGNNTTAQTLTPELEGAAADDGSPNTSLKYDFKVYDPSGTLVSDSGLVSSGNWTVPSGKLKWGQTYYWAVQAYDGALYSAAGSWSSLTVQVPQPAITSSLSQNSSDHGFDPSIGNYTTSDTDASVSTVGPALDVDRSYNSRDPRITGAFGAGWSSVFDSRATEVTNASGTVTSVNVTYPDGSEVGYGKNSDGTFSASSGRFATLKSVSTPDPGYTLTDKNDTVYTFTKLLSSGVYGINSVTDADGRAVSFTWTLGHITLMTSAVSGRTLELQWSTPTGATAAHVKYVFTQAADPTDSSTTEDWEYLYTGDALTTVCAPTTWSHCTQYGYASSSGYLNQSMDRSPDSFWPLSESSGTTAASQVLTNEGSDNATYSNVTLGQSGPWPAAAPQPRASTARPPTSSCPTAWRRPPRRYRSPCGSRPRPLPVCCGRTPTPRWTTPPHPGSTPRRCTSARTASSTRSSGTRAALPPSSPAPRWPTATGTTWCCPEPATPRPCTWTARRSAASRAPSPGAAASPPSCSPATTWAPASWAAAGPTSRTPAPAATLGTRPTSRARSRTPPSTAPRSPRPT